MLNIPKKTKGYEKYQYKKNIKKNISFVSTAVMQNVATVIL